MFLNELGKALYWKLRFCVIMSVFLTFLIIYNSPEYSFDQFWDVFKAPAVFFIYVAIGTFPWFELGWIGMAYLGKKDDA